MYKKENNYTINGSQLLFEDCKLLFDYTIGETLRIEGILIIRLEIPIGVIYNENIFAVCLKTKKIIWQIARRKYYGENCPFTDMDVIKNQLRLFNWCGVYLDVNPVTGDVLNVGDSK